MRVDLAAQVLSESVSKAFTLRGGEAAEGTACFLLLMDKFFDCTNVKNYSAGARSRKPFQLPYLSADDERLTWLKDVFLTYLDNWEISVKERGGFSKREKNKMQLSKETLLGLRMTVLSLIELVSFVFTIPGVKSFLTQKICQDPLENFFGCQRQRGGTHDNPTVAEFEKNMQALRVINSFARGPAKGNCRGQ